MMETRGVLTAKRPAHVVLDVYKRIKKNDYDDKNPYRMAFTRQKKIAELVKKWMCCVIFLLFLSCAESQTVQTKESFIENNSDLLPSEWNGWMISKHPDHGYSWIDISSEGYPFPRAYHFPSVSILYTS